MIGISDQSCWLAKACKIHRHAEARAKILGNVHLSGLEKRNHRGTRPKSLSLVANTHVTLKATRLRLCGHADKEIFS